MGTQATALLTAVVIVGALGGYMYGAITGRLSYWMAYTVVVATAGAAVALATGYGSATFVAAVSILCALMGRASNYTTGGLLVAANASAAFDRMHLRVLTRMAGLR